MARVKDKATGQIIEVPDNELGSYGLSAPQAQTAPTGGGGQGDIQGALGKAMLMDLLTNQGKNVTKIKTVQDAFKADEPSEPSADEKKTKAKMETLTTSLDVLEKNLKQVEARGPIAGRSLILSRLTGGALYPESSDYEALRKGMIGPVARAISGEVGVLTDKDIARAEALLPKISDTQELSKRKMDNLRELIAKRTGGREAVGEVSEEIAPKESTIGGKLGGILGGIGGFMVGGPPGAGLGAVAGYGAGGASQEMIQDLLGTQKQKPLEQVGAVGGGAASAGVTAYSLASLLNMLKGGAGLIKGGGPKGLVGKARNVAATEAQKTSGGASTSKMIKSVEEFFVRHPEAKTKANLKLLEGLKKSPRIPVEDLLGRTQVWNDAYKSSGGVAKGLKNKIYDILAKEGKKEIARVAPEVARRTGQLKFLYKAPRELSKKTWQAVKAGALWKMLSGGF